MDFSQTLILSKSEIVELILLNDAIKSVEKVFKAHAEGFICLTPIVHADMEEGEFHIKAGGYKGSSSPYFTTKINGGFFSNGSNYNLPSILGLIVLSHTQNGFPLAVMDSSVITTLRTAAAMGVAVKYLANPLAKVATICGCGKQAPWLLRALKEVSPLINAVFVYSTSFEKSIAFSNSMSQELQIEVLPTKDLETALKLSQICITCTSSKKYFVEMKMIPPGMFIAAMGADSPDKQEIDPLIFEEARIVVDIQQQCAVVGELHHALKLGLIDADKVVTELGHVVKGTTQVRKGPEDIIIFDSTGTAMQDTALASLAYERAIQCPEKRYFQFFS